MLFPRPQSAQQIVRRNLARTIADTGDLYGKVLGGVEDVAEPEADVAAEKKAPLDSEARVEKYREKCLKIMVSHSHSANSG